MTTFQLTTWDRVVISQIIGAIEGDLKTIRIAGKLLDAVEMKPEESAEVHLRVTDGMTLWDEPERLWNVEITSKAAQLLSERLQAHRGWQSAQHRQVDAMLGRLGIAIAEE